MTGRSGPIRRASGGESSSGSLGSTLVTAVAVAAVFAGVGVVAKLVYDALPPGLAFPGFVVALAVSGFGGLYAVLRLRDRLG
ncbi:hypothetical protein M0R88_10795 [Halorussus gelatinilyticus]|uniref:Uncharacterized protein n=1 Tax=Halorussus gelatinilyticus TaxID=2937524 RepID=A0A8U0IFE8_9EURY|nr:hypothetical protein [Halorussus gelatinilyticus]UPV99013.1 hypothetical protein M0R88_10795 [Halorussus gelatinilyticus]